MPHARKSIYKVTTPPNRYRSLLTRIVRFLHSKNEDLTLSLMHELFQNNTVKSTLRLIAVNSNAMMKCDVKLETEGHTTRNNGEYQLSSNPSM